MNQGYERGDLFWSDCLTLRIVDDTESPEILIGSNSLYSYWENSLGMELARPQRVFKERYNYRVDRATIVPDDHSAASMHQAFKDSLNSRKNDNDLWIIHYDGHPSKGPQGNRNTIPDTDLHSFTRDGLRTLAPAISQCNTLVVEDMSMGAIAQRGHDVEQDHTWSTSPCEKDTCQHIGGQTKKCEMDSMESHAGGRLDHKSERGINDQKQRVTKHTRGTEADPPEHDRGSSTRLLHCFGSHCDAFLSTVVGQNILHELRCGRPIKVIHHHHEHEPPHIVDSRSDKTFRISLPILPFLQIRNSGNSGNSQGSERRRWQSNPRTLLANFSDLAAIVGSLTSAAVVTEYGNTERNPPGILSTLMKALAIMGHDRCASLIPETLRSPSADMFVTCSALWILCSIWLRHRHQGDRFQDHAIVAAVIVALGGHLVLSVKRAAWDSFGIYLFFFVSVAMCLSLLGHGLARNRRNGLRLVREQVRGFEDAKSSSNEL